MSDYLETYRRYVREICPDLDISTFLARERSTRWEEPETALDFHNSAAIALIEAENSPARSMLLDMALEYWHNALEIEPRPLYNAHLALVYFLIGERETSSRLALSTVLQAVSAIENEEPAGLIYVPPIGRSDRRELLESLLESPDPARQALSLAVEILHRSPLAFYNASGLRFLELATGVNPRSSSLNRQLGIAKLIDGELEGLFYLRRAADLAPGDERALQALYIAYRGLGQTDLARFWQSRAEPSSGEWKRLSPENPFTYLPFEEEIPLAVEASFQSFVTGVLAARGDWFEAEMEFWRSRLQPGMTVIDVGANAGVYTFSAARRVGKTGKVIAIEPFSRCIDYLEETCRINGFSWVYPCRGAAGDRAGTVHLSLHGASELNEIIPDDRAVESIAHETVPCFPLDHLIETDRVDLLKIDAEGHEIRVLEGARNLLDRFSPIVLYENIAAGSGSNLPVARRFRELGYRLYRYRPYLEELLEIGSENDLQGCLNIIALPDR